MTTSVSLESTTNAFDRRTPHTHILYLLFALSGVAGLIYEVVWFQFIRYTVGANSQTLAVLLACFMGGLFVGSALYARLVPNHINPLKIYAILEVGIALCGAGLPYVLGAIRGYYFSYVGSSGASTALRIMVSAAVLLPPTVLMGATLPALARWVRANDRQSQIISRLYAANIAGAVIGCVGAAFILIPIATYIGANWTAVFLNLFVAGVALVVGKRSSADAGVQPTAERVKGRGEENGTAIYLAYALSGCAALAFEVLWSRLLGMAFGATIYAFAIVLGVFLTGLSLGGVWGGTLSSRMCDPRHGFGVIQLLVVFAVGGTSVLTPWVGASFVRMELWLGDGAWTMMAVNLLRTVVVVFPGAVLWGMAFPFALRSLGSNFSDAAAPVGRLYAFNTIGAVIGALASGFILFPRFGSQAASAHLVILPLAAGAILLIRCRWSNRTVWVVSIIAVAMTFLTPYAGQAAERLIAYWRRPEGIADGVFIFGIPIAIGVVSLLIKYCRGGWAMALACSGAIIAYSTEVPHELYMLGSNFGRAGISREFSDLVLFEEGIMEPVAVFYGPSGDLSVSINSRICASATPGDMQLQRMMGHVPVLLSHDPEDTLVVGLGAGVTAGAVSVHREVKNLWIAELEPRVQDAARCFGEFNQHVMDNPKTTVVIDDARHFISAGQRKFGAITSDPVHPRIAGAAALFTVEYFELCRDHLIDGGVFAQWIGLYELTDDGLRSILAAFAEAFPHGTLWMTATDAMLIGGTKPLVIDVERLNAMMADEDVRESLAYVGVQRVEDVLSQLLCDCKAFGEYLKDAPVNRDGNLYLQFSSGLNWRSSDSVRSLEVYSGLRNYPYSALHAPNGQAELLRSAIESNWDQFYEEHIASQRKVADERASEGETMTEGRTQ